MQLQLQKWKQAHTICCGDELSEGYVKLYACFHMQSFFSSWRKGGSKRRPGPRKALGSQVLVLSDAKSRGKEEKLENINLESNDQILKETEGLVRADKMCETAGLQSRLQVV